MLPAPSSLTLWKSENSHTVFAKSEEMTVRASGTLTTDWPPWSPADLRHRQGAYITGFDHERSRATLKASDL